MEKYRINYFINQNQSAGGIFSFGKKEPEDPQVKKDNLENIYKKFNDYRENNNYKEIKKNFSEQILILRNLIEKNKKECIEKLPLQLIPELDNIPFYKEEDQMKIEQMSHALISKINLKYEGLLVIFNSFKTTYLEYKKLIDVTNSQLPSYFDIMKKEKLYLERMKNYLLYLQYVMPRYEIDNKEKKKESPKNFCNEFVVEYWKDI